jgi:hypothetical protein
MAAPKRIQRQRKKGWCMPENAIYVGRPSKWGNPFKVGSPSGLARVPAIHYPGQLWEYEGRISAAGMRHDYFHPGGRITEVHVRAMTAAEVVQCYRAYVTGGGWPIDWVPLDGPTMQDIRAELAGKDLVCWCPLFTPCHADVLLEIANSSEVCRGQA